MVERVADGAIIVELQFAGIDWLVREVLKEAGDAVVLEPADAREAVLAAVDRVPAPMRHQPMPPGRLGRTGTRTRSRRRGLSRRWRAMTPAGHRRAQIAMSDAEVVAFLTEQRTLLCATERPARLAARDAAVVRAARPPTGEPGADVGVDLRGVAEGRQHRA